MAKRGHDPRKKVRYAVVGLGHIAQNAVLPAFAHAKKNSELTALVSGDERKLRELARTYDVRTTCGYDDFDGLLADRAVDAVYIALPNDLHEEYTVRAARHGVHVLCEKPMAVTAAECRRMVAACRKHRVKLLVAYRLHFEEATLVGMKIARSGRLGELRYFHSAFSMQVERGNVRLERERGGGTLYDIGIYCINAARSLFHAEPDSVLASSVSPRRKAARFGEVDEMTSCILRYPGDRLATFTSSFGAADRSMYEIVGTKGSLRVEPAYEYAEGLAHALTIGDRTTKRRFGKRDQFAAEIEYFSDCVRNGHAPEPSGTEGENDVRIIEALYAAADKGTRVRLSLPREPMPEPAQEIRHPPVKRRRKVKVRSPRRKRK